MLVTCDFVDEFVAWRMIGEKYISRLSCESDEGDDDSRGRPCCDAHGCHVTRTGVTLRSRLRERECCHKMDKGSPGPIKNQINVEMTSINRLARLRSLRPTRSLATHASNSFFIDEPTGPKIITSILPGPKSVQASTEIGLFQDNRTHIFIAGESCPLVAPSNQSTYSCRFPSSIAFLIATLVFAPPRLPPTSNRLRQVQR